MNKYLGGLYYKSIYNSSMITFMFLIVQTNHFMKKLFIIIAVNLILISCKNTDFENPEAVVRDFSQLVIDNKLDDAYELITDFSAKNYSIGDFKKYYGNLDSINKFEKTEILKIEQIKYDPEKPDFRLFSISKRTIVFTNNDTTLYNSYFTVFKLNEKWKIIWVKPLFKKAAELSQIGKYNEAKAKLEKAFVIDPYNGDALAEIAWLNCLNNDNEEGINIAKRALELTPNESRIFHVLATLYKELGEHDLAIENFSKAISLCQNNIDKARFFANLALTYIDIFQYNKALEIVNKGITLDPIRSAIWRVKGSIYSQQQKNDSATICLSKSIKLLKSDEDNRLKEILYDLYANASFNLFTENKLKNITLLDSSYKYIVKAIDIDRENQSYRDLLDKVKREMK
jgi:tetratricopeptide (TPR) repeat protein